MHSVLLGPCACKSSERAVDTLLGKRVLRVCVAVGVGGFEGPALFGVECTSMGRGMMGVRGEGDSVAVEVGDGLDTEWTVVGEGGRLATVGRVTEEEGGERNAQTAVERLLDTCR